MRIGCLQFAPVVGDVDKNLDRADAVLDAADPEELDILILPELAFSGYNFKSLRDIAPFLEKSCAGVSTSWARSAALRYDCTVVVGYPETADVSHKWPCSPEYFNAAVIVNEEGENWGHYRKTHLYYTDETWSLEGNGFYKGYIPGVGKMAMGICMDIKFEAPWDEYEFANHALKVSANLVVVSMAWLTREPAESFAAAPKEPDVETLTYWVKRMEPLIKSDSEDEIIVVFANRCGVEDDAVYAGTSAVLGIQNGEVTVYGLLGRGESKVLVVDTDQPGFAKLVYRPEDDESQSVEGAGDASHPSDAAENMPTSQPDVQPQSSSDNYERNGASDTNGRTLHDHVFLGPDALAHGSLGIPGGKYGESPISPRYFVDQQFDRAPLAAEFPNEGIHSSYREWRSSLNAPRAIDEFIDTPIYSEPQDLVGDIEEEFSNLMTSLPKKSAVADAEINRPFSTKSRNTSRAMNGQEEQEPTREVSVPARTASRAANHITSHSRGDSRSNVHEQRFRSSSINRLQDPSNTSDSRPRTPELHQMSQTPELSRVDISELMIVEEEGSVRPKRDSLLCHVDQDDYVVMRREEFAHGKGSPKVRPDERSTSGRETPRSLGQTRQGRSGSSSSNHNHSRTGSNSKRGEEYTNYDRTDSRSASRSKSRQQQLRSEGVPTPPVPSLNKLSKKSSRSHVSTTPQPSSAPLPRERPFEETVPLMEPVYRTRSGSTTNNQNNNHPQTAPNTPPPTAGRRSRNNSHHNRGRTETLPSPPQQQHLSNYTESPRPTSKPKTTDVAASMNTEIPLIEQLREHRRRQGLMGSSLESNLVSTPVSGGGGGGDWQRRGGGQVDELKQKKKGGRGEYQHHEQKKKNILPPTPKAFVVPDEYV